MGFIASQQQLLQEVQEAFASINSDAVVLHPNLLRIRFVKRGIPLQQQLADLFQILVKASAGRTLLFPTFNYDFCQTRLYHPLVDPCQVGTLNEYVRQLYPSQRTLTPIFNFCIYNNRTFSLKPVENPFSEASTFAELVKYDATVVFFGSSFDANTFIHYVEEIINVGYRYIKPFPGVISQDDTEQPIAFRYRVRPLINGAVDYSAVHYDWDRLTLDLFSMGVLHQLPLGSGTLLWFRAIHLIEDWCKRLKDDELYLLSATSRKKTQQLYAQYGKPLRYEAIEQP